MRTYKLKQVNAFTSKVFSGNPAGVLFDARGLSDATMQAIAQEMNLSETAFVLPPSQKGADLQLRWFTPSVEVPLCGHATIASFHVLAEEGSYGMKRIGSYSFRLQTKSGILPVIVEKKYSGTIIEMGIPTPSFRKKRKPPSDIVRALGLKRSDIHSALPTVSDAYLYIPVKRLRTLQHMVPDFALLKQRSRAHGVLGVSVFTLETKEMSSSVHSRFYAPAVGIDEDPVTGSANGPFGVYLYKYALSAGIDVPWLRLTDDRMEFIGEQGDEVGRKGRVKIRVSIQNRVVKRVSIAGEAVTVFDAELRC
jgi:trans-2,3-dihydro-3-hydroxyanthranilate isomerase